MAVAGSTATFSGSLPTKVGVGDVLQYQGTSQIELAFVHGRVDASHLTVKKKDGSAPAPAQAGTLPKLFRAYRSLANWQRMAENTSIDATVRNFDDNRDLVAAGVALHVACYDDGAPDTESVSVPGFWSDSSGWITDRDHYIRIYTPVSPSEVGVSQRHRGKYGVGYRLEAASDASVFDTTVPHLRLDGLSFRGWYQGGSGVVGAVLSTPDVDFSFTHNVVDGNSAPDNEGLVFLFAADSSCNGRVIVANNVVYSAPGAWAECFYLGSYNHLAPLAYAVYNNSAADCFWGYSVSSTADHLVVKNNIAIGSTNQDFEFSGAGGFGVGSTANCSSDSSAGQFDGGTSRTRVDASTVFVSRTVGSEDLHLAAGSPCSGGGVDLSADPVFPVVDDIDGDPRPAGGIWDMGADQAPR